MIGAIQFFSANSTKRARRFFILSTIFGSLSTIFEISAAGTFSILASSVLGGKKSGVGVLSSVFPLILTTSVLISIFSFFFVGKLMMQVIELKMKNKCAAETFNVTLERQVSESDELDVVQRIHTFNHQILYPLMMLVSEITFAILFIPFILLSTGFIGLFVLSLSFTILFPLTRINSRFVRDVSQKRNVANIDLQNSLYENKRLNEDLGFQKFLSEKSKRLASQVNEWDQKYVTLSSNPRFILEFVFLGIVICVLWFSEKLIDQSDQIYLFAILGYSFFRFVPSLTRIGVAKNQIDSHSFVFDILDSRTTTFNKIENKTFFSDFKSINVLNPDLFSRIRIPSNKWVLIKGPTGIGKTRFLKILAGISSEQFLVQTDDGTRYSRDEWTPSASFVSQAPYLGGDSLFEMVGLDSETFDKDEVNVDNLFDVCAIDQKLRRVKMRHQSLSGGQRKQIALMRALLSRNDFLVLDEFTAGLDYRLASQILSALKQVSFLKTVIMSTHEDMFDSWFDEIYIIS